jgi:uncharacterized protein YutD
MDPNVSETNISPLRPKSLTVLCYLTIFASMFMILSSFGGIFNPEEQTKRTEELLNEYDALVSQSSRDEKSLEEFQKGLKSISLSNTTSNTHDYSVFTLIFNVLTLSGAFLMLRLKKNGFRLYVLGNIIAVVSALLVYGSGSWLGISYAVYHAFTGFIFVLLYALKMKYME